MNFIWIKEVIDKKTEALIRKWLKGSAEKQMKVFNQTFATRVIFWGLVLISRFLKK